MDEDEPDHSLFLAKPKPNSKGGQQHPRSLVFHQAVTKGKEKEEVAEAVSPGGHVTKRRARSRPLSAELREQAFKVPKSPIRVSRIQILTRYTSKIFYLANRYRPPWWHDSSAT